MKADQTQQFVRTIELKDKSGRVLGTKEVITYQGLLSKAHDDGLKAIRTTLVQIPLEENGRTAIAKATVETEKGAFEGLGDASPDNVTPFLAPHLIRMAETRAKARALRDAVNVGVVSFEELDGEELPGQEPSDLGSGAQPSRPSANGTRRRMGRGLAAPREQFAMSENQRRFLFRLLAERGFEQEAAHEELLNRLEVATLSEVTKERASALIDELQQSRPRGNGLDVRGASLQR